MSEAAPASTGRPWPQVGQVSGGRGLGTGFLVGPGRVLTVDHIVGEAESLRFENASGGADMVVERRFPELDLALLRGDGSLSGTDLLSTPVALAGPVRRFPIGFLTWGYRELQKGSAELLIGEGVIRALRNETRPPGGFQLRSDDVRPGMSGAPIAVAAEPRPLVVGVVLGRHHPADLRDKEGLALGQRIVLLPPELLAELGGLRALDEDEDELTGFLAARAEHYRRRKTLLRRLLFVSLAVTAAALLWAMLAPGSLIPAAAAALAAPFGSALLFGVYERTVQLEATTDRLLALSRNRSLGADVGAAMRDLVSLASEDEMERISRLFRSAS